MKRKPRAKKMQAREMPGLLTPDEAAAVCKVSPDTLVNWRVRGVGPRYIRMGRAIRYSLHDLAAYMAARTQQSTSENHRPKRAARR